MSYIIKKQELYMQGWERVKISREAADKINSVQVGWTPNREDARRFELDQIAMLFMHVLEDATFEED